MIKEFLASVNQESGKTENRFNLAQLDNQLLFKPGEEVVRAYRWGSASMSNSELTL